MVLSGVSIPEEYSMDCLLGPFKISKGVLFLEINQPLEIRPKALIPNLSPPSFNTFHQVLQLVQNIDTIVDSDVVLLHHPIKNLYRCIFDLEKCTFH